MGRTKNNNVASSTNINEPILDPIAEGIVVDEFANEVEVQSDKEDE